MFKRILKNEKGSAMLMAIMGFAIISIFTFSAIFMATSNFNQTDKEGKKTQAYYLADIGAKTMVKHLEGLPKDKARKQLEDIEDKPFKGEYEGDEFEIEVTRPNPSEDVYELKSTAEKEGVKDWTIAVITLEEKETDGGGGYEIGDGVLYINSPKSQMLQFHNLSQFSGTNLNIHTRGKSVVDINDGTGSHKKIKSSSTGEAFQKGEDIIAFNYNLNKEQVLKNYSSGKLPDPNLKGEELAKVLSTKTYLLPISTIEDYEAYLNSPEIFPIVKYKLPAGEKEENITFGSKGEINLVGKRYVSVAQKVELKKGITDMKTSGDIDINLKNGFHAELGAKLNIHADGRVNIYIDKYGQTDGGDIEVFREGPNAQVNFYVNDGVEFQMQDATKVIGVNLYAPSVYVQFQEKVQWEGVVIANELQFNDNAKFKAPSAGALDLDASKVTETDLKIEWKR